MAIVLTFDIAEVTPQEHNRIQSFFERFGWENLGGSSYRYPRLGSDQPVEDWFNHVIPALMLFRTFIVKKKRKLSKFTLDIQSSAGFNPSSKFGMPPVSASTKSLYKPFCPAFGEKNLIDWLNGIQFPY